MKSTSARRSPCRWQSANKTQVVKNFRKIVALVA
jgi:hypothetical protein